MFNNQRPTQSPMAELPFAPNAPRTAKANQFPQTQVGNLPDPPGNQQAPGAGQQGSSAPQPTPQTGQGQGQGQVQPSQAPMQMALPGTPAYQIQNLQMFLMNPPTWARTPEILAVAQRNLMKLMRTGTIVALLFALSTLPGECGLLHRLAHSAATPLRFTRTAIGITCYSIWDAADCTCAEICLWTANKMW